MASIFRQTAIERLSSPDRLDSMLKITTPLSWVGIAAAALLSAVVVVWSVVGSIPSTAAAPGFLVGAYGTNTLYSAAAGTVSSVLVERGDAVEEGTPVLELTDPAGRRVTLTSGQRGVIASVLTGPGEEVTASAELFRLSPRTEGGLVALCYTDMDTAARVEPGMRAAVFPAGAGGQLEARVVNVDSRFASVGAISEILGQDGQMAALLTQNGPVVAVTCELAGDAAAAGLAGGEQVTVQLILDESAPIEKVFPALGGET